MKLVEGNAIPVIAWQEQRCYSNVSEAALTNLAIKWKCKPLPVPLADAENTDRLACQLLLARNDELTGSETKALLAKRSIHS